MEELVFAAQGAHLGLQAVGKNQKGVVVEEVGNGVQVVGVVVRVGVLDVHRGLFELHKEQRDSVDKAHNVGAAAIEVTVDFQLFDGQEVVVVRALKVDDRRSLFLGSAAGTLDGDWDAVPDQGILLLVGLHQGCGGEAALHLLLRLLQLGGGEPRIQPLERLPKIPDEQNLPIACPAKSAVFAQLFGVVGIGHLPAQLLLQHVPGALLDKNIFGVVVAHGSPPCTKNLRHHFDCFCVFF